MMPARQKGSRQGVEWESQEALWTLARTGQECDLALAVLFRREAGDVVEDVASHREGGAILASSRSAAGVKIRRHACACSKIQSASENSRRSGKAKR